ncbi:MAG: flagellin [Deltaproteobacteria bacterium]|nr:flagellin [Deltaproteobacteria bacterium]
MRVSDKSKYYHLLTGLNKHQKSYNIYAAQVSTGIKLANPSDGNGYSETVRRENNLSLADQFLNRIGFLAGYFSFLEENLSQANSIIVRAKEIAQQAANETYSIQAREHLSLEVFQLRDHLVQLANSTYQGRYVWGGVDDDDPPFDQQTYTVPASGPASVRYVFDSEPGTSIMRSVKISHDFEVQLNESGFNVFARAIGALERLGRALAGYSTNPPSGLPNGTGSAYSFPNDYQNQTSAIRAAIDLLEQARSQDISNHRTIIASKMTRLDIAKSIITMEKESDQEFLVQTRDADIGESATRLTQTENLLQTTYKLLARVSNLNLLDYI